MPRTATILTRTICRPCIRATSCSTATRIPRRTLRDGIYVLNPGSVSIPKAGSWHGYMTLENGVFTWKTLSGDVRDTLRL